MKNIDIYLKESIEDESYVLDEGLYRDYIKPMFKPIWRKIKSMFTTKGVKTVNKLNDLNGPGIVLLNIIENVSDVFQSKLKKKSELSEQEKDCYNNKSINKIAKFQETTMKDAIKKFNLIYSPDDNAYDKDHCNAYARVDKYNTKSDDTYSEATYENIKGYVLKRCEDFARDNVNVVIRTAEDKEFTIKIETTLNKYTYYGSFVIFK